MSKNKVVLITGASRGIGKVCAISLAKAGYSVAVHYSPRSENIVDFISDLPSAKGFKAELTNEDDCKNLIKAVKQEMGSIDVLVNNAGISIDQVISFAKPEDFDKMLSVNLKPVFLLTKLVSRVMIKQKGGRIINMSSVVGHTGNAGQSMYSATKGALTSFTMSIARDLAGFGILANCIAPGFIDTDMTRALPEEVKEGILNTIPLKRLGSPEEIAKVVDFLAGDQSSYITGSTIHVNGGMYCN